MQLSPSAQAFPQAPQWAGSDASKTQAPSQGVSAGPHGLPALVSPLVWVLVPPPPAPVAAAVVDPPVSPVLVAPPPLDAARLPLVVPATDALVPLFSDPSSRSFEEHAGETPIRVTPMQNKAKTRRWFIEEPFRRRAGDWMGLA